MAKRSATDSLDKIKTLVEGNPGISVTIQNKILKCVNTAVRRTKPVVVKEQKKPGASQFEKKMDISDDMKEFAGWGKDDKYSRVDVTKAIWEYIKTNNLRNESNKRLFTLDDKLKKLLKTEEETLTYPKIQKHIADHMIKPVQ